MKKKNLFFVCSEHWFRSPTAEDLFKDSKEYNSRSAGTSFLALVKVSEENIKWADAIICMEKKHKDYISEHFPINHKKIHVLNIPNHYFIRNSKKLKEKLTTKLKKVGIYME